MHINFKNKKAKNILDLKSKLNQASVLALSDWQSLLCHASKSSYIFILGELCHIYKPIHID